MEKEPVSKKPLKWIAALCVLTLLVGACSNDNSSGPAKEGSQGTGNGTGEAADAGLFPKDIVNQPVHEGTPRQGGTLTFGLESTVLDTSPNANVIQPADVQMAYAVFDPLVTYGDAKDDEFAGNPVTDNADHRYNQLADKLVPSDDLKTWTLTLRSGIEFSNGKPLTAKEVVDHTNWVRTPDGSGGKCACASDAKNIENVEATGDLTVVYTLKEAVVDFPGKLTGGGLGWITESSAREAAPDPNTPDLDHLIGTGPFVYQSKSGDSYTLVKNDKYYGVDANNDDAKLPYLDKIIFKPLDDSVTRLQAVQSNGVQIIQTADTSNLVQAKKDENLTVQPSEGSSSTILVLNLTHPPFGVEAKPGESAQETAIRSLDDPTALESRQAFNYSINRNEINQKYYKGTRVPAYGFIPSSSPWYDPKGQLPRTDVAKATALIKKVRAAGVNPDVNALCINTPESSGIFQILKEQAKAVGVNAKLKQVEQAVLVNILLSGSDNSWGVACFRSPQIADPNGVYNALVTGGTTNLVKYSRPDVDKWLNEARSTTDQDKRKELYDKVQEQVAKDVVYVPLLFDLYGNVFRNDVSGLTTPSASSLGIIRPGNLYYTK